MNPNQLDLNLLRVFDAILEARSVTAAASTLGLTQSTVSNQLARLREAFDDPLFVRTSEGMAPTPRAEAMAESIRNALVAISRQFVVSFSRILSTSDNSSDGGICSIGPNTPTTWFCV